MDPDVIAVATDRLAARLAVSVSLPHKIRPANTISSRRLRLLPLWPVTMVCAMGWGPRLHHRPDDEATRAVGFGEEVQRRILIGKIASSHGYYDAYYLKAQKVRRLIKQDFDTVFTTVDTS